MRHMVRRGPPVAALLAMTIAARPARAAPVIPTDAITREVSVFAPPPRAALPNDAMTREVSVFASPGRAVLPDDAVTREVSVFVAPGRGVVPSDAVTREVSVYARPPGEVIPTDAITREASIYIAPYEAPEALEALRIAAGLSVSTPAEEARLDVRNAPPGHGVDLTDAAEILRLALGLTP